MSDEIRYHDLGYGITCIDTQLYRSGLAACYLIEHDGMVGFVDTGTNNSVSILQEVLRRKGIANEKVNYIMPTHVHLDHAGASGKLMQEFPEATLLAHPHAARHLADPTKLIQGSQAVYGEKAFKKMFGKLIPVAVERIQEATDGFELDFNGRKLLFIDTPGHARHHYCIYDEQSSGLFTGDTFGASYPELNLGRRRFIFPPTTPVQFDPDAWLETIDKLMELSPARVFITHFGMHEGAEGLAKLLRQAIRDYAAIAQEFASSENRCKRISECILQDSINYLLDQHCGADVATIRHLISFDMELNAQGLDYWLTTQNVI